MVATLPRAAAIRLFQQLELVKAARNPRRVQYTSAYLRRLVVERQATLQARRHLDARLKQLDLDTSLVPLYRLAGRLWVRPGTDREAVINGLAAIIEVKMGEVRTPPPALVLALMAGIADTDRLMARSVPVTKADGDPGDLDEEELDDIIDDSLLDILDDGTVVSRQDGTAGVQVDPKEVYDRLHATKPKVLPRAPAVRQVPPLPGPVSTPFQTVHLPSFLPATRRLTPVTGRPTRLSTVQIQARARADVTAFLSRSSGSMARTLARAIADAANPLHPKTIPQLVKDIRALVPGASRRWAETVARTETARVYGRTAYERMLNDGVTHHRWLTAAASPAAVRSPVCEACLANAAAGLIPIDESFPSGDYAPPAHPRCLPGDTLVLAKGVTAVSERWYQGQLVSIRTRQGYRLRCTPNHPVLTPRGWVPAGRLNVGDHVVSQSIVERLSGGYPDDQHMPALIEEVVHSFGEAFQVAARPVKVAAEDFHGDGIDGQVAVIWSDRQLGHRGEAPGCEHVGEVDFQRRGSGAGSLPALGRVAEVLRLLRLSPDGGMGGFDLPTAGGGVHMGPLYRLGFGLPPRLDASEVQPAADDISAYPLPSRETIHGLAGEVVADELVEVSRFDWSGHVFNLETESSIYIAEGIMTHNCRCVTVPPLSYEVLP